MLMQHTVHVWHRPAQVFRVCVVSVCVFGPPYVVQAIQRTEHRVILCSTVRAANASPRSYHSTPLGSGRPQVVKAIQRGEHTAAPLGTSIWWAHRLLSGRRLLGRTQQRALIR